MQENVNHFQLAQTKQVLFLQKKIHKTIALSILCSCFFFVPTRSQARTIAFFYALDADLQSVKAGAQVQGVPLSIHGRTVTRLKIGAQTVYAIKMDSGAVETTISATMLLARYQCDLALSVGPMGALSDTLQIGNWYPIDRVVSYQKGVWSSSGFSMIQKQTKSDGKGRLDEPTEQIPPALSKNQSVAVASGEIFVASTEYRKALREETKADAVDMNLFGLISACQAQGVPLLSWRIVSDKADDDASHDFQSFLATYDGDGGRLVAQVIRDLPPNPASPEAYPAIESLLEGSAASPH